MNSHGKFAVGKENRKGEDRMRHFWKKATAVLLVISISYTMMGCSPKKSNEKEEKATPAASVTNVPSASSAAGQQEEVKASGKGNNKSDVPLVVGNRPFNKKFNPFSAQSAEDERAVKLTQLSLITVDREGALVNKAIDGEVRRYNGENYTYQGAANVKVTYLEKKDETVYTIRLRDDLVFSNGEPLTVDDVIFSMYAFADTSYEGCETFGELAIKGLNRYRGEEGEKEKKWIAGIERVDNYRVRVTTEGYDRDAIYSLNIPICPLHFYGDEKQYDYEKNRFGFQKGDIRSLLKKKNSPMGAGAYKFIKYESGIVYYEANDKYYKDCPLTAFIQLKEIDEDTAEHKIEMMAEGEVDIVTLDGDNQTVSDILATNSSGKLNGGTISTRLYDGASYAYIGMNAKEVCVAGKPDSTRSKNLRKGLATMLGCHRLDVVSTYAQGAKVIDYPASDTSWSVPQTSDEEYTNAFVTNAEGQIIYSSEMNKEERSEAACKAALSYLKLAGYKVKKGKVVEAPSGASKVFRVLLSRDGDVNEEMYRLILDAKVLFERTGLKLKVVDNLSDASLKKNLKKGKQQIWCGLTDTEVNGRLNEMFHSRTKKDKVAGRENFFGISDSDLDEYIEESRITPGLKKSIRLYGQCYGKVMEWAVMVPVSQQRDISIFSSSRINMDTVVSDITAYYGWLDEIQSMEMK